MLTGRRIFLLSTVASIILCGVVLIIQGDAVPVARAAQGGLPPTIPTPVFRGPTLPAMAGVHGTVTIPAGGHPLPANIPHPMPARKDDSAGIPAITPYLHATNASKPGFTEQDVSTYVTTHGNGSSGRIRADGPITVTSVTCATVQVINSTMDLKLPYKDDRLVCAVKVSGDFTIVGPPGGKDGKTPSKIEVFDARTGNHVGTVG